MLIKSLFSFFHAQQRGQVIHCARAFSCQCNAKTSNQMITLGAASYD